MRRAVLILALVLSSCGESAPAFQPGDVQLVVELSDYAVSPSVPTIRSGEQRIGVRNRGGQPHDLIVIRTDAAPDRLPYDAGRAKASEEGAVARTDQIRGGGTRRLDVTLAPGRYVLICNVPGHYQLGMRAALEVRD